MKKLQLLIMPVMTISLLINCGGSGNTPEKVEFSFSSEFKTETEAMVYVDWKPTEHSIKFDSFDFTCESSEVKTITFDKESGARPMPVDITFANKVAEDIGGTLNFTYEDVTAKTKGESSINVTIKSKWFMHEDWWNYCSNGGSDEQATEDDIKKVVPLTVNGQVHQVRLIDVDKDVDESGNKIHTTFEFVNLISDENGYSLATYWNDTNDVTTANHDYLKSSIRKALIGDTSDVNWFRFYGLPSGEEDPRNLEFAKEDNYKISVLNMLPNGLVSVLKTPSKYVNVWNDEKKPEAGFEEQTINDKLFLLSPREMGYSGENQETQTFTYSYYKGHVDQIDGIRIKKQINGTNGARNNGVTVTSGSYTGGDKHSYAGHNTVNAAYGSYPWCRSPNPNDNKCVWYYGYSGSLHNGSSNHFVYNFAYTIAPAFCI